MNLITTQFYEARYGTADTTKIAAFIEDVSAEVVSYVETLDTDTDNPISPDQWTDQTAPQEVKAVVARVVNRSITNPWAVTQEGLGDHNVTYATGASGGTLGPKDKKIIRRAVGRLGANTVALEGFLPIEPESLVEFP